MIRECMDASYNSMFELLEHNMLTEDQNQQIVSVLGELIDNLRIVASIEKAAKIQARQAELEEWW